MVLPQLPEVLNTVTAHRLEDIKSVYQDSSSFAGFAFDFSGDLVLKTTPIRELSPADEVALMHQMF